MQHASLWFWLGLLCRACQWQNLHCRLPGLWSWLGLPRMKFWSSTPVTEFSHCRCQVCVRLIVFAGPATIFFFEFMILGGPTSDSYYIASEYCGGPWIWGWQNCTSRAQKLEPHLLVKVHSASAPWLNHCRSQCNIRLAAEIDIVIFEWQQEGVGKQRLSNSALKLGLGKQRLSNSCLKTGAGKAEVEQ